MTLPMNVSYTSKSFSRSSAYTAMTKTEPKEQLYISLQDLHGLFVEIAIRNHQSDEPKFATTTHTSNSRLSTSQDLVSCNARNTSKCARIQASECFSQSLTNLQKIEIFRQLKSAAKFHPGLWAKTCSFWLRAIRTSQPFSKKYVVKICTDLRHHIFVDLPTFIRVTFALASVFGCHPPLSLWSHISKET